MILTPTHLAIVMEYASGGELFERICNAGRFSEDEVSVHDRLHIVIISKQPDCFLLVLCFASPCRPASFSSNLYQVLAIVIQWYVRCISFSSLSIAEVTIQA